MKGSSPGASAALSLWLGRHRREILVLVAASVEERDGVREGCAGRDCDQGELHCEEFRE